MQAMRTVAPEQTWYWNLHFAVVSPTLPTRKNAESRSRSLETSHVVSRVDVNVAACRRVTARAFGVAWAMHHASYNELATACSYSIFVLCVLVVSSLSDRCFAVVRCRPVMLLLCFNFPQTSALYPSREIRSYLASCVKAMDICELCRAWR